MFNFRLSIFLIKGLPFLCLVSFLSILNSTAIAAGEVDTSFAGAAYGDLISQGRVQVVEIQPDGKILIGGSFTEVQGYSASGLARLNPDGTVDTTFNAPDFYNSGLGSSFLFGATVNAIVVQPDGKILVGGDIHGPGSNTRGGIRRLNPDGSLDPSFFIYEVFFVHDIELQADGKIVAGGFFSFSPNSHVVRLNTDGTRDLSFSPTFNAGVIKDIDIQPDGKIIAGGSEGESPTTVRLYRLNTDGTTDGSFSAITSGVGVIEAIEVLGDGKVLIAGSYTTIGTTAQGRVSRINSDGTLDTTFNTGGAGANAAVNDVAIRPDGKIIIGGAFSSVNGTAMQRIARLNSDGTLDNTFTNSGTITDTTVDDVELLPDNRILAGLNTSMLLDQLLRFSADGAFDPTFVVKATRGGSVNEVLQQPDGKILVAGEFLYAHGAPRRSIARFNADGSLDTSFVPYFNNLPFLPIVYGIALQADGKIVVGMWHGAVLQRLNSDGSQDMTFNPGLPSSSQVYDVAVQADGKIVVVGHMMPTQPTFARFNTNGSRDMTFNPAQPDWYVRTVLIQPDGKILLGGAFGAISDIAIRHGIARFNSDGVLDNTFVPPPGNGTVLDIDVQPDGKVVLVGNTVRRLNADGTLQTSLASATNGEVSAVRVQPDGKILIGGGFSVVGTTPRNGIARLTSDFTLDTTFTTFANRGVREIQLQSDGKILLGGMFTKVNGIPSVRVARLLNPSVPDPTLFDYDGDGKADVSVFRPSENRWYIFRSSDSAITQTVFAIPGDVPVPADYDGDRKTDIAIYRPSSGAWWYLSSINGAQIFVQWGGEAGDVPRPGDFDGDGKADFIIFRPTNNFWYRISSGNGAVSNVLFGLAGDKPVRGDFDGDGSVDPAIFRPSTGDWWYRSSINHAQLAVRWGLSTDIPAPADFDGDSKTDIAVYRPSTGVWYIINSSNGSFTIMAFGLSEDKPVPADYDGDGRADIAVFRPSTGIWYLNRSTAGFTATQFGIATDIATPNAFVP